MYDDIIGAISTPLGEGGIAIVRVSGEGAIEKINKVFQPRAPGKDLRSRKPFTLTLGYIKDEEQGILDEVLVSIMKSPRSYTGEEMVEINCHGGALAAKRCLQRVLSLGIRLAQPGEFTQRAFLNGKMDAVQAEAVIDIIRAKTERGLKLALKQMEGKNSQYIKSLEDLLLEANMLLEASLDFSEDIGDLDYRRVRELMESSRDGIDKMLRAGELGDVYKEGISVAICGKPNVGKSSLLNALLRKERAIVTDVPGTTRDVIEEYVNIQGIPVKIIDTAGIRDTSDLVEKIGIDKARQAISEADLVVLVLDVEAGMTEEDMNIYRSLEKQERIILLINKDDLMAKNIKQKDIERHFSSLDVIWASTKDDIGIQSLAEMIEKKVTAGLADNEQLEFTVSLRQKELLKEARQYIQEVLEALELVPMDCLGVDMQNALISLGQLTGRDLKEESIDRIFREFCIGK
ncbi:MAG: tRNA uridine-5-carboxymethylaminomethyl(34) synthesis GTPase MnmE [Syntrophomonadaceae bacterium]|jgi:tRNA modification GTPase|nr:tRNA uridine-5-carboxymethylaminomethyl(34) synthesis GTPase MnmE [Syntrophomonadaceae bacterium]